MQFKYELDVIRQMFEKALLGHFFTFGIKEQHRSESMLFLYGRVTKVQLATALGSITWGKGVMFYNIALNPGTNSTIPEFLRAVATIPGVEFVLLRDVGDYVSHEVMEELMGRMGYIPHHEFMGGYRNALILIQPDVTA